MTPESAEQKQGDKDCDDSSNAAVHNDKTTHNNYGNNAHPFLKPFPRVFLAIVVDYLNKKLGH